MDLPRDFIHIDWISFRNHTQIIVKYPLGCHSKSFCINLLQYIQHIYRVRVFTEWMKQKKRKCNFSSTFFSRIVKFKSMLILTVKLYENRQLNWICKLNLLIKKINDLIKHTDKYTEMKKMINLIAVFITLTFCSLWVFK